MKKITYAILLCLLQTSCLWAYTLTLKADGCENAKTFTIEGGTVKIEAVPNAGYGFLKWNDGNTDNPRTVTVTGNKTYTATFAVAYTITAKSNNTSYGTVSGGGEYGKNATATLTATPKSGYKFVQWNDGNTDNPRTITVTGSKTYTATFAAITYTITVNTNNTSYGTVSGGGEYEMYSNISLTAIPKSGFGFVKWSDGNIQNPRSVSVTKNAVYTAIFEDYRTPAEERGPVVYNDGLEVSPYKTMADFTWSDIYGAASYSLIIWQDARHTRKICTLNFDSDGQLTNIDFTQGVVYGMSFTVTGLVPGHTYGYALETYDVYNFLIDRKTGTFTTQGVDALTDVFGEDVNIYAEGRNIIIENAEGNAMVSDALGRVVCAEVQLSPRTVIAVLAPGVYMVRIGNKSASVLVN